MDANGLKFWMLSREQDWALAPPTPVSASGQNVSALEARVGVADTQIVLTVPLPGGSLPFVLIDSEVMAVTAVDSSGLQLTVTRGAQGTAAANHPPGALVWGPVTTLTLAAADDDAQITIAPAAAGTITS